MDTEDYRHWDLDHYKRILKFRPIAIEEESDTGYVDYHTIFEMQEQDLKNGAMLVDQIITNRFFPNGIPVIPCTQ